MLRAIKRLWNYWLWLRYLPIHRKRSEAAAMRGHFLMVALLDRELEVRRAKTPFARKLKAPSGWRGRA